MAEKNDHLSFPQTLSWLLSAGRLAGAGASGVAVLVCLGPGSSLLPSTWLLVPAASPCGLSPVSCLVQSLCTAAGSQGGDGSYQHCSDLGLEHFGYTAVSHGDQRVIDDLVWEWL